MDAQGGRIRDLCCCHDPAQPCYVLEPAQSRRVSFDIKHTRINLPIWMWIEGTAYPGLSRAKTSGQQPASFTAHYQLHLSARMCSTDESSDITCRCILFAHMQVAKREKRESARAIIRGTRRSSALPKCAHATALTYTQSTGTFFLLASLVHSVAC